MDERKAVRIERAAGEESRNDPERIHEKEKVMGNSGGRKILLLLSFLGGRNETEDNG